MPLQCGFPVPGTGHRENSSLRSYLLAFGLLALIFGGIGYYNWQRFAAFGQGGFTPPPVTVAAGVAEKADWVETLAAVGTVRATRGVELSAETSGEIIEIPVGSGQEVQRGDLLLVLDDSVEQATKKRLEANLELARLLFDRDASLVEQKSIPQSQYDRSRADLQAAIAQLSEIEARLDNKRIRAPFSGRLGIIQVKVGDYIESGDPIATLQDLSELELDFPVPDRYAPRLHPGLKASVRTAAFPGREFPARLQAIDSRVDASTRNLMVRARVESTEGLLPGMFANITIELGITKDLVVVPETAVSYSVQGNLVYVIVEGEQGLSVDPRVVRTGRTRGGRIAILDGVAVGERVVTAGQNKIYRGAGIVIDESVKL
jgi:membrane fusion protein (multidrug efflux system)